MIECKQSRLIACAGATHIPLALLVAIVIAMPAIRDVPDSTSLFVALGLIEIVFIIAIARALYRNSPSAACAIVAFVWVLLMLWELGTTKTDVLTTMIFPAPEAVFAVFANDYPTMAHNALYSLGLLATGYLGGILLGAAAGVFVAICAPLRGFIHPIAKVLAPIPPMVISPYVILVAPTFRMASVVLVGITVFFFVFLGTIEEVKSLDKTINDSMRMLELSKWETVRHILMPYILPSVVRNLKLYLIMGFMMLIYAETLGAPYGLGNWIYVNHMHANYAKLIAGFIEIGVFVTLLNALVDCIQKRVIPWQR